MRKRYQSFIPYVCLLIALSLVAYVIYAGFFPKSSGNLPYLKRISAPKEKRHQKTLLLGEGDTLAQRLNSLGIPSSQAYEAIKELSAVFDPKDLQAGQKLDVLYEDRPKGKDADLLVLSFQPDFGYEIELLAHKGRFKAAKVEKKLKHETVVIKGTINISLYVDALRAGASPKMLYEMIKAFSYDVDFQRDIHPGTEFTLVYDAYRDQDSGLERPGDLSYAQLVLDDKPYDIYRFQPKGGIPGYYTAKGEGIKKALLKTPIDGARLTSGFGNRRHPIKGYTKMHKGVDFGAPRGTPIMAAGEGVVERAGRHGGYGNYVCIRHSGATKTAYAHLSKYGKGIRPGQKVKQGQIIGYVGCTGLATGPHLHFEVIQNGKHVNPQKITQLPSSKLGGKALKAFKALMEEIRSKLKKYEKDLKRHGV